MRSSHHDTDLYNQLISLIDHFKIVNDYFKVKIVSDQV